MSDYPKQIMVICWVFIVVCSIFVGFSMYSEATKIYPETNITVKIIEKYDPSHLMVISTLDGVEHTVYTNTLENYMSMHRDRTYNVTISLRSDNSLEPIWSNKYNYIVNVIGEVK